MRRCGPGCGTMPELIPGGVSAGRITTPAARAGWSTTRRSSGSGATRVYGCRDDTGVKRLGVSTVTAVAADAPNRVWAVDFQFDATNDGRPVKIVSIVDEHTRECLGGLVERGITAEALIDELDRVAVERGYPSVLRSDNGPELACAAMRDWAGQRVGLAFIPPGQPWRNGYIDSFNGRLREECLTINLFWSLTQAGVVISDWKDEYHHHRRHSALGYQTPASYAAACIQ
jgi:putative transposase